MNDENLIPLNKRTKNEQRAIQLKGAAESARKRRERMEQAAKDKEIAGRLQFILDQKIPAGELRSKVEKATGIDEPTYMDALVLGAINKGIKGNPYMFDNILATLEQKPAAKNQVDLSASPFTGIDINIKKG